MSAVRLLAVVVLVVAAAVAGCSDDEGKAVATTTTTSTSTTTTTSPPASTTTASGAPTVPATSCTSDAPTIPDGAGSGSIPDVDGDGQADTGFIAESDGTRRFGIVTSAGGGAVIDVESASPVGLRALVVDADEKAPVEILISDNRGVQLFAFVDCSIVPITNPEGQPYTFDLGNLRGNGTGVGCVDTPDGRRLVGLQREATPAGRTVNWTRTIIELDGTHARNGDTTSGTYTRTNDDAAIALLDTVSCGDLTITRDGIAQPPG